MACSPELSHLTWQDRLQQRILARETKQSPTPRASGDNMTPAITACAGLQPALSSRLWLQRSNKDKLHDVLDEAVVVIDAKAFERSQKDPRGRKDLFKQGQALHAKLAAKNANF